VSAIVLVVAGWLELIASAARMFPGMAQETAMPSEGVRGDSMDPAHAKAAIVVFPAWDLAAEDSVVAAEDSEVAAEDSEVEAEAAGVGVVAGAGRRPGSTQVNPGSTDMKSNSANTKLHRYVSVSYVALWACVSVSLFATQQPAVRRIRPTTGALSAGAKLFDTPRQAADALIDAAEKFDVSALTEIFGADGDDVVFSGEFAQDRKLAADFATEAREKKSVSMDPKTGNRAFVLVGSEDWPFPVPLVKRGEKWFFDSKAGRHELQYRRIGANELDAIEICRGYVEAQNEYALQQRRPYEVNQYAQRIVSTPGAQDGLAWQNSDGTWAGPIGENVARAIEQGYTSSAEPYHGYFFKILKGQGSAAPLGEMDFVVKGLMIGGFALVAAPAEYDVTGVRTFVVSHDGVVYQKDLGPKTLDEFKKMERFNPDKSWAPVLEKDE
jgi:hypothetical protein